jgi:hypothetical protein
VGPGKFALCNGHVRRDSTVRSGIELHAGGAMAEDLRYFVASRYEMQGCTGLGVLRLILGGVLSAGFSGDFDATMTRQMECEMLAIDFDIIGKNTKRL